MIQLRSDCLVFEVSDGDKIPCSAETVTLELLGDAAGQLDPHTVREAAAAVLHYFRQDLGRDTVTVAEFTEVLERVLRGLGFDVKATEGGAAPTQTPPGQIAGADLESLYVQSGGHALTFFARLREHVQALLHTSPPALHLVGLKRSAQRLAARQRWCPATEAASDEIVRFVRACWQSGGGRTGCTLVIR
ncbi:MAG: hypothetical protein ACKVYV_05705 [Limisphaerales bacterium]